MSYRWWADDASEQTFYRVRMRSGAYHVRADPALPGTRAADPVRQDHPLLLKWMGENGLGSVDENGFPQRGDNAAGTRCGKCGAAGVENHHWAPREYFGPDYADEWPQEDLCVPCHAEWHRTMNAWAEAIDILTTNEDDPVKRRPARALTEKQRERAEQVAEDLLSVGRNGKGRVSAGAKYLAFRLNRLLDATKHETPTEEPTPAGVAK